MTGKPMTLEELKNSTKLTVSPTEASGLLGCSPYNLNVAARSGHLHIRHFFAGRNLRISRADLLAFCTGSQP